MTFVKIKVGDYVYDKREKYEGVVTHIDHEASTADIDAEFFTIKNGGTFVSRLHDLVPVTLSDKTKKTDPNKWYNLVRDFQKAFNHPVEDKPTQMGLKRATSRAVWTGEEALVEFIHASSNTEEEFDAAFEDMIQGLRKAKVKSDGMNFYEEGVERIVAQSDALIDALYFLMGSFVEMGVKPDKLLEAVQNSNMSKLFEDGLPRYRESDGKILKSPQFFQPEPFLKAEIERQLNQ